MGIIKLNIAKLRVKNIFQTNETFVEIYGLLESEIKDLRSNDKEEFFNEYNIHRTGLNSLIKKVYEFLNLITFYTAGPKECRAWSILRDSRAPNAAGKIHSDFEKGFIRAEVVRVYSDFINVGNEDEAKKQGLIKSEGKDYIVQDGDIIHFRYNV